MLANAISVGMLAMIQVTAACRGGIDEKANISDAALRSIYTPVRLNTYCFSAASSCRRADRRRPASSGDSRNTQSALWRGIAAGLSGDSFISCEYNDRTANLARGLRIPRANQPRDDRQKPLY